MNSKLILTPTTGMSQTDWLLYRKKGIGASDVSTVLGLNPYKSSIEFFYEQINQAVTPSIENMAMFMGTETESFIANLWQYWEGDEESIIRNFRAGKVVRKCRRINAYVSNPDYPWLFVSLDRVINKTSAMPEGALEIKNVSGYSADKWEHGIPPGHVVQVQTQVLVTEFIHGELATMVDGRNFSCLPFKYETDISETIIKTTKNFWDTVVEARKISSHLFEEKAKFNYRAVERLEAELTTLEPPPDGSVAYMDFLKKKYQIADPGERVGTDEQFELAKQHKELSEKIQTLQQKRMFPEEKLKNIFRDQFDKMDFGARGYVSWKTNKAGSRTFLNKIKTE